MQESPTAVRERLVTEYTGFAKTVARKLAADRSIEVDDAVGAAYVGLMEAVQKFDVERALAGEAAGIGPLEANFKSLAFLRIRGAILDEIRRQTFVKRRGHEKGVKFDFVPLDRCGEDGAPLLELPSYEDFDPEWKEALSTLDERERFVITGIAQGYTSQELSKLLDITPSRVSQLNRRAKVKLRDYLAA